PPFARVRARPRRDQAPGTPSRRRPHVFSRCPSRFSGSPSLGNCCTRFGGKLAYRSFTKRSDVLGCCDSPDRFRRGGVDGYATAPTEYEPAIVAVPAHLRRAETVPRPAAPQAQAGRVLAMTAAPTTGSDGSTPSAATAASSAAASSTATASSPPDPFKTLVGN